MAAANTRFMVTSVSVGRRTGPILFRRKLWPVRLTPMPPPASSDVTRLLRQWSQGDKETLNQLVPLIYAELRQLAHHRLRHEPADRSLNTTGLVHDAYLKLIDVERAQFNDRSHFLAMASRVMRRLLVDQARARRAAKRGRGTHARRVGGA